MDDTSIEGEVVHVGGRRVRARRPVITALASVPESTSSTRQKDEPAAHEVINLWRNLNAIKKHHARPIITTNTYPEFLCTFAGRKDLCFCLL